MPSADLVMPPGIVAFFKSASNLNNLGNASLGNKRKGSAVKINILVTLLLDHANNYLHGNTENITIF